MPNILCQIIGICLKIARIHYEIVGFGQSRRENAFWRLIVIAVAVRHAGKQQGVLAGINERGYDAISMLPDSAQASVMRRVFSHKDKRKCMFHIPRYENAHSCTQQQDVSLAQTHFYFLNRFLVGRTLSR